MSELTPPPLALTCGDPAGIGPDITLAAWQALRDGRAPGPVAPFFVLGVPRHLAERAALLQMSVPIREIAHPGEAATHFSQALPVLPLEHDAVVTAGEPDAAAAPVVVAAIERAVQLVLAGEARAVVTNPIAKEVLYRAGFAHPGHTEFLGALAEAAGLEAHPVMMLAGGGLRVVPVTIHIPLAEVPARLTTDLIVETGIWTAKELRRSFAIARPRLVLCGLNPHAGEGGTIGREDEEVVAPAARILRDRGIAVQGPLPADTLFHASARENYDAALGMYHDQVLIPIKTLAFDEGVNITLGLPFVRTSPDHGTAFALAGSGRASPRSLLAALTMAARLADNRAAYRAGVDVTGGDAPRAARGREVS